MSAVEEVFRLRRELHAREYEILELKAKIEHMNSPKFVNAAIYSLSAELAEANHWRHNYADAVKSAEDELKRLRELLRDAPCTCPDADTAIGMLPGHREENKECFRNRASELIGECEDE